MNIRPLHDRVVVEPLAADQKTAGGIIIPDTAQEKPSEGKIVAVGSGYRNDEGKVTKLVTAAWPPEQGVTKLPPLGGHPSQLAAYRAYASAFSNGDASRYTRFYTDDVVLDLSSLPPIETAKGIAAFYDVMFQSVRETLTIHTIDANDERIEVDCTSTFTAIEDAPDFVVGALAKGDSVDVHILASYTLRDGYICKIHTRRGGDPVFNRAG